MCRGQFQPEKHKSTRGAFFHHPSCVAWPSETIIRSRGRGEGTELGRGAFLKTMY